MCSNSDDDDDDDNDDDHDNDNNKDSNGSRLAPSANDAVPSFPFSA